MHAASLFTRYRRASWLLWLLLPALLLAQWAGLAHRMAHGGGQAGYVSLAKPVPAVPLTLSAKGDDSSTLHSCALYDAAASADYLHAAPAPALLGTGHALRAARHAASGWQALLRLPFSSRAPPFLSA